VRLQDLEDGATVATKNDIVRLENRLDAAVNKLEARLNRLEWLVWLPVISTVAQIVWGHK
jgi:hypothetical protein